MASTTSAQVLCSWSGTHDFNHVNVLAQGYFYDLRDFVGVRSWTDTCLEYNVPLMLATASVNLGKYCPKIPKGVYDLRNVPIYGGAHAIYDFRPILHYCDLAKNFTQNPSVVQGVQF